MLSAFYDFTGSYGLAIILLTVVIRTLMIPLAIKQAKMMVVSRAQAEKMKKIQPEMKRLKEKHRDDRTKLYEETKKLQQEHGVSIGGQLGGCLPMLLQMPILFAMYRVLNGCYKGMRPGFKCPPAQRVLSTSTALGAAIVAGNAAFLGMNLIVSPSAALKDGVVGAIPYYLMVALMGLTMWVQQKQTSKATPATDPQMAQMQRMMMIMPVMVTFISLNLPAGLTLYWVATNVWTIGQQFVLFKKYAPIVNAPSATLPATAAGLKAKAIEAPPKTNGSAPQGQSNGQGSSKPKGSGARKGKNKKKNRR